MFPGLKDMELTNSCLSFKQKTANLQSSIRGFAKKTVGTNKNLPFE